MRVKQIRIKNIMGVAEIEVMPNRVTLISGKNATGKTSIMSAIASIIGGGHDASLLRKGEQDGEAVIVFDDGLEIEKTITENNSKLAVSKGGMSMKSPAKYVKELFGSGFNPVNFLNMNEKSRIDEILKNAPINMDVSTIEDITSGIVEGVDYMDHPLNVIDKIRTSLYDSRTGYNRVVNDAEKTKREMRSAIVDVDPSVTKEIEEKREELSRVEESISYAEQEYYENRESVNAEEQEEIDNIKAKYAGIKESMRNKHDKIVRSMQETKQAIRERMFVLANQETMLKQQEQTRRYIDDLEKKIQTNNAESLRLSEAIRKLDKYKAELVADINIAGHSVNISDGKLLIDDIPYEKLNTAAKVSIAMSIAEANMGEARLAVIDGAECLDSDSLSAIAKEAEERDIQLIMFRVSEDAELTIEEMKEDGKD
jgi:chromosome segregation ATPase